MCRTNFPPLRTRNQEPDLGNMSAALTEFNYIFLSVPVGMFAPQFDPYKLLSTVTMITVFSNYVVIMFSTTKNKFVR